jgi:hypothetical protein
VTLATQVALAHTHLDAKTTAQSASIMARGPCQKPFAG